MQSFSTAHQRFYRKYNIPSDNLINLHIKYDVYCVNNTLLKKSNLFLTLILFWKVWIDQFVALQFSYLFFLFMFETSLQFHKKLTFSLANQIVALYKFCVKLIWDGLWISLESLTSFLLLFSNTKPDTFAFSRWMTILQKEVQNILSAKMVIFHYLKSQKQNALSLGT